MDARATVTTGAAPARGVGIWLDRLLAVVLAALGLALAVGGGWLVALGGSSYDLVAGLLLLASAWFIARHDRRGPWLYGGLILLTLVWGVAEIGWDFWGLAPRLGLFLGIGLWMVMPWGPPGAAGPKWLGWLIAALLAVLAAAWIVVAVTSARDEIAEVAPPAPLPTSDWSDFGGPKGGGRFSPDGQITPANVAGLRPVWTYHSGDLAKYDGFIPASTEVTPIKIGDRLYACSPFAAFAIDADTGRGLWRFEPGVVTRAAKVKTCRGVAYDRVPGATGPCSERILWATVDARLFALDAATGRRCPDFGVDGAVDLTAGLGEARPGYYFVTSAPLVAAHKAIVGGWVDDNADVDMPSGVIRAFDTTTGKLAWAWDMGLPDRPGAPPPGETYTRSTPNAWGPLSADEALGLAYVPLGNPSPDFWGGRRRPFDEHYGSSVVALDLATGRPRWSFQMAHHDLWDYDTPSQPTLIDLPIGGRIVPALVQSTKQGELFVLDRRTGQPLTRVAEKPVPQGAAPGDHVSPTQPFSVGMPTLRLPVLQERDMWGVTPIDAMVCRIRFRQARYDGPFTPPSPDHETLTFPGSMGVTDWGGVSIDPVRHLLIANISAISYRTRLVPRAQAPQWLDVDPVHGVHPKPGDPPIDYWYNPQVGTPFALHTRPFLGPLGVPCTRPPWGRMVAIDLATRKEVWNRTIGTARDSGPMGYPTGLPIPMGTPNIGGTLVTRGGLIFFGGTLDRYLRAYSVADGRELWRSRLPAGAQAGPMSYVTKDGRQLVVVAAGGHIGLQTKLGDAIIAYGLPAPRR